MNGWKEKRGKRLTGITTGNSGQHELRGLMTQQEVANVMGLTRQRISQIERSAIAKLREQLTRGMK